jgi:phosphoribosylanthranilate isomerase
MTKIKVCGITNLEDARQALELGADLLGFNFYMRSPRYITPEDAADIISQLPRNGRAVGVFVNSSIAEIEEVCEISGINFVQLHGDETPEFVTGLRSETRLKVMKAFRCTRDLKPEVTAEFPVETFLLDSDSDTFGGSGNTFDWNEAARFRRSDIEFYLAGGLTPENVAQAIRMVRPHGVDVCSGVELSKGKKDMKRLGAFIRNVRSVG